MEQEKFKDQPKEESKSENIVVITEQTLAELVNATLQAKKENKGSVIKVKSSWSSTAFVIHIETVPYTQESLGYHEVEYIE